MGGRLRNLTVQIKGESMLKAVKPLFYIAVSGLLLAGCAPPSDTADAPVAETAAVPETSEAAPEATAPTVAVTTENARTSYELGYAYAKNIGDQFPDIVEQAAFVKGVEDALTGAEKLVPDEEARQLYDRLRAIKSAESEAEATTNLAEGQAFLETNGTRDGVVTLASGLQYEIIEQGEGAQPTANDSVTTHYEGTLIDGSVFDSSYTRGQPATFPLRGVIPGWTEGLQLMKAGGKFKFFIPPDLAYGPQGRPGIPGNSTLIFVVELISVDQT